MLSLLLIISFHQTAYSQITKDLGSDFIEFFTTGADMASDFTKFDKSTPINLAGSAVLIGAGYSVDNNTKIFSQKNLSSFNDKLFYIDKVYGSGYTLVEIGGLYGYGLIFRDKSVRRLGLQTIEAVGYAGIITSALKSLAGRSRPFADEGKAKFRPINFSDAHTSFPSGHAAEAFAVSTVLANNTDNIYLKIICYTASSLVACARIYHNDHWFSDVITSSLIGYFTGNYVSEKELGKTAESGGLSVNFSFTSINLSYSF